MYILMFLMYILRLRKSFKMVSFDFAAVTAVEVGESNKSRVLSASLTRRAASMPALSVGAMVCVSREP